MAGVHDHSRYAEDPLGRLAGTVRWVVTTTFGSTQTVDQETSRVARLHDRVKGTYPSAHQERQATQYSAKDQDLVAWVHSVFTDAFLAAHRQCGDAIPITAPGESGEDSYVREWATAGELMGLEAPPRSRAELQSALEAFQPVLRADDRVTEALRFLRKPPLPGPARIPYAIMVGGAIATMEPRYRDMLGLKRPWWPAVTLTGLVLWLTGVVLGTESTSRRRAKERLDRLGLSAE
jgi:uncharacterized protein (DUF2236 family)